VTQTSTTQTSTTGSVPSVTASLHLFGVRGSGMSRAISHMATDRWAVRNTPGLRFVKLLGTGDARTFTPKDADPRLWGVFSVWESPDAAMRFSEEHRVIRSWQRFAHETAVWQMRPLRWKGEWSGKTPFGSVRGHTDDHAEWPGPTAVITRARIRPRQLRSFLQAVPPVAADIQRAEGLVFSVGIGEAPIGLQATFSVWQSADAIDQFAYREKPHQAVVKRTATDGWYAEEMFARFAVVSATGTVKGASMVASLAPQADRR
jgi:hypothetical protein